MRFDVGVTCIACGLECNLENRLDVAAVALCFPMSAQEAIVGITIVVEDWFVPLGTKVAHAAFGAIVFLMVIVFEVTRNARYVHFVFERVVRMTFAAG